uniref:Uncharacterized protein n=1 Tax=Piliocolobus tephrosceles TaxID=591936 RepID=A0A8C9GZI3_9PRIM
MWMGLIQLVEGVKRNHQAFREKEFYHKTNIKMWCEFLACWPAFTVLEETWGDQVDWSRLLRDAGVVNMSRKPRASSPLSKNHLPTPKRRGRGNSDSYPVQPTREKGPVKEVPGTEVSP